MPRKDKPGGSEIARKAKHVKLDHPREASAQKDGKRVTLIPARLEGVSEEELENGQVIAVLETELDEEDAGLPPGRYNQFLARVGGEWQVLAESGGTVVAEGRDVRFEKMPPGRTPDRPRVELGSIWIWVCICLDDLCWCASWRFLR